METMVEQTTLEPESKLKEKESMFEQQVADALAKKHPLLAQEYVKHKATPNLCFKRSFHHILGMQYSTSNNLARKNVVDKRYAKFRSQSMNVLFIYDTMDKKFVSTLCHRGNYVPTIYTVNGKVDADKWFLDDMDEICTHGIHFYLTLQAAICHNPWSNYAPNFSDNGVYQSPIDWYAFENCDFVTSPTM